MAQTLCVSFEDTTNAVITGVFGGPMPLSLFPNQGEIDTSSGIWKTYFDAQDVMSRASLPAPTTA